MKLKQRIKNLSKKEITISRTTGIILLLILAAISAAFLFLSTEEEKIVSSIGIKVNYKDGTSQVFDSSTLMPGAIVGIDKPGFSSITTIVNLRPIVEASDGSAPTTPIPGKPIIVNTGFIKAQAFDLSGSNVGVVKEFNFAGMELNPNTDNLVVQNSDITPTLLDTVTNTNLPNGGQFRLKFGMSGVSVSMGGVTKQNSIPPSSTLLFRKDVGTAGTNILSAGTQICYYNVNGEILSSSGTNYNVQLSSRTTPVVLSSSQFTVGACDSPPTLPTTTTYILQSVSVSGSFS